MVQGWIKPNSIDTFTDVTENFIITSFGVNTQ